MRVLTKETRQLSCQGQKHFFNILDYSYFTNLGFLGFFWGVVWIYSSFIHLCGDNR